MTSQDKILPFIVVAFKAEGYTVINIANAGHGFPDLVVAKDGKNYLIAIKTPLETFTLAQRNFQRAWKATVHIVQGYKDANLVMALHQAGLR